MREYETSFIVQPEISEEGSEAIRAKLDGILENGSATRLMCEDLGKRKLAYEIRRFQKGHYYILSYLDEGKVVPDLERTLRLEESVLRFMTVQVTEGVADVASRLAEASEVELAQTKRAEERAEREAEEARARAAAEEASAAQSREAAASEEPATVAAPEQPPAASEEPATVAAPEQPSAASEDSVTAAAPEKQPATPEGEAAAPAEEAASTEAEATEEGEES